MIECGCDPDDFDAAWHQKHHETAPLPACRHNPRHVLTTDCAVYRGGQDQPRLFRVRVYGPQLPFAGIGFVVKCPTRPNSGADADGVRAMSVFLAEQVACGVIRRYQVGLANLVKLNRDDPLWRSRLVRFPDAWNQIVERIAA